ncbi:chromosome partitioning protein ParA [Stutzerimonas stutzeri]|uniref:chromosome partitioning protein ParA n=1 Tax=Stutzerimonas stutzeri TaxID=316 RepID=UPI000C9A50FD|nr:chromosome partitioning protein ParA [Stutzerimonas stutzeri]PNG15358.1 chromosome partitioning protein ParA [Stutzerimonas stutzeri]
MQIKPQTVEAVLFFNDGGVCKEMLYPEFEAVLDGMVSMPEFADQQMRVVYVLINTRLQIRAAVFFFLDFNEDGSADSGWNIPLRNLAERTGRGPDLGAGPIRLACRSQCPVSWYQMHLWDPELTQSQNHLVMLRDRIKRNQLGLLVEEDTPQAVPAERLQMVAEDAWYAADSATQTSIRRAEKLEQEQRLKAAQLIKQQRLRIASLEQQREADISRLRELAAQQQAKLLDEIAQLRQELLDKEGLVEQLQVQLHEQAEGFQKNREEMSRQLRALEQNGRAEADAARAQFDEELRRQIAAAVAEYKEQVSIRDVELAYRNELDSQLQEEIEQLRARCETLAEESGDRVLERLCALGVAFMAYHPGAGHLTIPLADITRYRQNPLAYAAAKCAVSEEQYKQWVEHYQQPVCIATLSSGERCNMPLDKVETPARFVLGESNCCARHRSQERLRTGS